MRARKLLKEGDAEVAKLSAHESTLDATCKSIKDKLAKLEVKPTSCATRMRTQQLLAKVVRMDETRQRVQ